MPFKPGNSECTEVGGFSTDMFQALIGDSRNGFSNPMSSAQEDQVRAICWAAAQAMAAQIPNLVVLVTAVQPGAGTAPGTVT